MLEMNVTYLTPSGGKLNRRKPVRSLRELEEILRIMKSMGYRPLRVKIKALT